MYYETIRQLHKSLGNLDAILAKATTQAAERGYPVDNFMTARLAPDMLPFPVQVTIACDVAKFAGAVLAGKEVPKFPDGEKTVAELRERIGKTLAFLDTLQPGDFARLKADTIVPIPYPPGKAMHAQDALFSRTIPNFYFHMVTAYALLRHGGITIGKMDYLGELKMFDA